MTNQFRYRPVHPFPARMAPSIALDELATLGNTKLKVLDPMVGSGTTLVAARSLGHESLGFDTDPLAIILADVWVSDMKQNKILSSASDVLAKASRKWKGIAGKKAYPIGADAETKEFVRYWFNLKSRKQLSALATQINLVSDKQTQNVLWCAFSRLIIAKNKGASWAMDLSHSRPHKVMEKEVTQPIQTFLASVQYVMKNMPFGQGSVVYPKVQVRQADARSLPVKNNSIDVVITSPPYLNAIDYVRCNKFSLIWMGHIISKLRKLRSDNIGSETGIKGLLSEHRIQRIMNEMGNINKLSERNKKTLARYVKDMDGVIKEISRVLVKNGKCIFVIGDCTMKGVFIKNSEALIVIGKEHGLLLSNVKSRELPTNRRYLPPPSSKTAGNALQGRMREEIVITMVNA